MNDAGAAGREFAQIAAIAVSIVARAAEIDGVREEKRGAEQAGFGEELQRRSVVPAAEERKLRLALKAMQANQGTEAVARGRRIAHQLRG